MLRRRHLQGERHPPWAHQERRVTDLAPLIHSQAPGVTILITIVRSVLLNDVLEQLTLTEAKQLNAHVIKARDSLSRPTAAMQELNLHCLGVRIREELHLNAVPT